jgi:hypothetical protein
MCYPLLVGKKLIISDPVSGCINEVNDSGHIFDYLKEWKVSKRMQIEKKEKTVGRAKRIDEMVVATKTACKPKAFLFQTANHTSKQLRPWPPASSS